mmetsp:Transcript_32109/g.73590  ORF Transcript_32109/g.73590 Transcript_32109/m.73590 type:complete len:89 (+) Transcript_32109:457-723(+)
MQWSRIVFIASVCISPTLKKERGHILSSVQACQVQSSILILTPDINIQLRLQKLENFVDAPFFARSVKAFNFFLQRLPFCRNELHKVI